MFRVTCKTDPLCACVSRKELDTGNDVVPLSVIQEEDSLRAFRVIMKTDLLSSFSVSLLNSTSQFQYNKNISINKLQ